MYAGSMLLLFIIVNTIFVYVTVATATSVTPVWPAIQRLAIDSSKQKTKRHVFANILSHVFVAVSKCYPSTRASEISVYVFERSDLIR